MAEDKSTWLSSHDLAKFLLSRRDNDVKVLVNGINVPVTDAHYARPDDCMVITLFDGEDIRIALAGPAPEDDGEPDVYSA